MEKIKNNLRFFIITTAITLLPIVIGIILWDKLPEQMVTHYNGAGEPDGWSSKGFAVFGLNGIILGVHLICSFMTSIDPKQQNINDHAFRLVLLLCPAISLIFTVLDYGEFLGIRPNVSTLIPIFMGLMAILIGNYLPKVKRNYSLGFKISWALESDVNWNKTHRLAGWMFVLLGFACILYGLMGTGARHIGRLILGLTLAAALIAPVVYSYLYYCRHKDDPDYYPDNYPDRDEHPEE